MSSFNWGQHILRLWKYIWSKLGVRMFVFEHTYIITTLWNYRSTRNFNGFTKFMLGCNVSIVCTSQCYCVMTKTWYSNIAKFVMYSPIIFTTCSHLSGSSLLQFCSKLLVCNERILWDFAVQKILFFLNRSGHSSQRYQSRCTCCLPML